MIFQVDLKLWTRLEKNLKKNGLKNTAYRIAKTWFIEEEKSKYFYLCEEAGKSTTIEAVDKALIAMKNLEWIGKFKKY